MALTARPAHVCGLFIADVDAKSFVIGLDYSLSIWVFFLWVVEIGGRLMVGKLRICIEVYILFEMAV